MPESRAISRQADFVHVILYFVLGITNAFFAKTGISVRKNGHLSENVTSSGSFLSVLQTKHRFPTGHFLSHL
jgi:hypothetical protein